MGSCELWAWESVFTGMEENYILFWWFPQKRLTDLSPTLSSLGFRQHVLWLPAALLVVTSQLCEVPWVSVALKWWCYLASPLGPLLSPHPLPLGLFTHSVGYHLQTNNSQIPVSNPALAPNTAIGRSTGPSAWFSEATQNQQTHKLLNSRSLHSAQPVFALLKGTIHDPVAKRQGRLIPILPPLSVPAGSWPAVLISSCPWTSLRSVCPSPSLPA